MNDTTFRKASLSVMALAAALALGGCNRSDNAGSTASTDTGTSAGTSTSTASTGTSSTSPSTGTAATPSGSTTATLPSTSPDTGSAANTSGTGTSAGAGTATGTSTTSSSGTASTAPLPAADQKFLTEAAAGGMFEVEVGKLAAEKATDPGVKSFAQMLVDDHSTANDKLRQIATGHNVALPASLPDDKKKELDQLSKLSGANFDKQFIKIVGQKDHHHDIAAFEKASSSAQSPDVKDFATNTLPTLKKHLAAAEKLPGKG
jgi:putative membrane protein